MREKNCGAPKPVHIFHRFYKGCFSFRRGLRPYRTCKFFSFPFLRTILTRFRSGSVDSNESGLATLQGGQRAEPGQAARCQEDWHAPQCHVPAQEGACAEFLVFGLEFRIWDSVLFFDSGMGKNLWFGSGIGIRDEYLGSYFRVLRKKILG